MALLLEKKQRLVMIGDSITDAGRAGPIGTFYTGLGSGYVSLVHALLTAVYPEMSIDVINVGIGGNTVRDLKSRWSADVLAQRPDWLTVMIGTNDVWRQFDMPNNPRAGVQPEEFAATYRRLIEATRPTVKGLVLLTPFLIEKSPEDPFRARIIEYVDLVKSVGNDFDIPVVDTQAAFDEALQYIAPTVLAPDRVHPTLPGHAILARELLSVLGFHW